MHLNLVKGVVQSVIRKVLNFAFISEYVFGIAFSSPVSAMSLTTDCFGKDISKSFKSSLIEQSQSIASLLPFCASFYNFFL